VRVGDWLAWGSGVRFAAFGPSASWLVFTRALPYPARLCDSVALGFQPEHFRFAFDIPS